MKALSYLELCNEYFANCDINLDLSEQMIYFEKLLKHKKGVTKLGNLILDFYSQPFIPELITKYFEGWKYVYEYDEDVEKYYHKYINDNIEIWVPDNKIINGYMIFTNNKENVEFPFNPRTLDDFINDCKKAGIELHFWEDL